MAEVGIRGVRKTYPGGFEAIKGIDCAVGDGEFLVMLGPSGCGKSTLLRMVAGLETISAGEVSIGGRVVNDLEPKDRDIAMVFQNYALYPHMTVFDNMAYGLKIRGMAKSEIQGRVNKAADILELRPFLERRPRQLSGGQRQRIALARAIIREPAAFLMDEPLSNLDARLRISMRGEIRRLQQRLGATTIYVTHDQAEALTMADRVCLIHDGVIQQYAPPQDVFDRPANRFVASFVGNPPMNVLAIALDAETSSMVVAGASVPLGDRYSECAARGAVQIGVRARDLEITAAGEPGTLPAAVYVVEPMGDEVYVEVLIGESRVTVRADRGWTAPLGAPVGVRVDPGRACFFEPGGGTVVHRVGELPTSQAGGEIQ
jgi:ABC-type sugar transport system ATPase subunit